MKSESETLDFEIYLLPETGGSWLLAIERTGFFSTSFKHHHLRRSREIEIEIEREKASTKEVFCYGEEEPRGDLGWRERCSEVKEMMTEGYKRRERDGPFGTRVRVK